MDRLVSVFISLLSRMYRKKCSLIYRVENWNELINVFGTPFHDFFPGVFRLEILKANSIDKSDTKNRSL